MKIYIPGYSTVEGKPETIIRIMQHGRRLDSTEPLEEFIQTVQQDVFRIYNISLCVDGETIAEKAESLLHGFAKINLIDILD